MAYDNVPAEPATVKMSIHQRARLMDGITQLFERRGNELFLAIEDLERDDVNSARAMSVADTLLEAAVDYLNVSGYPTRLTVGSLMDTLQLKQGDVHDLACYCLGPTLKGRGVAARWRDLNDRIYSDAITALAFADHLM